MPLFLSRMIFTHIRTPVLITNQINCFSQAHRYNHSSSNSHSTPKGEDFNSKCPFINEMSKRYRETPAICSGNPPSQKLYRETYDKVFEQKIEEKIENGSYRVFRTLDKNTKKSPVLCSGGIGPDIVQWCSNDYLGMSQHPEVISAMKNAVDRYGAGTGGTRNIGGTCSLHQQLEDILARLHLKEKALLFSSCYVANEAAIVTLGQAFPDMVVFSDQDNHASIISGIRNSRLRKVIFQHNNLTHLEELLALESIYTPKLIIFESVYSMSGDVADIRGIVSLASKYNALTFIDEVHAVGMYGQTGGGITESYGTSVDIISGTLGKAFGLFGGYIATTEKLADYLRSYSSGFIFTTSVPPALLAGSIASIDYLMKNNEMRQIQKDVVASVKRLLLVHQIQIYNNESHIIIIPIGSAERAKAISEYLFDNNGIYIQAINYPTVPVGTERLRIAPSPYHTEEMQKKMVVALRQAITKFQTHQFLGELLYTQPQAKERASWDI